MEKGFRLIKCPDCPKTLRIRVTAVLYGKTCHVSCVCGARLRVIIPTPAPMPIMPSVNEQPEAEDLFDDLLKKFTDQFDASKEKKE